ncbi:LEAF RUST DISEASE-RESISTANCE LOCUS RECEPTOR PROTEIN KINASE [Salix suchowensis]|nr:LEAF RUST DISEASE-RESISTANCE LOCUS RECEPTOR PROTEIN KINASE [Salix suchowensis]
MFISRISRQYRFGAYAALLLLEILSTRHCCSARQINNDCAPSSCGNILNISSPFRLNTDQGSCGDDEFVELACENNERLTLQLNMVKYYVLAINYSDSTIRVVDAAVQKDDCFSIPHHSLTERDIFSSYLYDYSSNYYHFEYKSWPESTVLAFICCENQILNPPYYIMETSSCKNGNGTANHSSPSCVNMEGYSYVLVEWWHIQDVPDLCRVNLMYTVPKKLITQKKLMYTDVHDILADGMELEWSAGFINLKEPYRTSSDVPDLCRVNLMYPVPKNVRNMSYTDVHYILADGFELSWFASTFYDMALYCTSSLSLSLSSYSSTVFAKAIYHVLLFPCGLPCLLTLLIYKWRRRHLSMYDNIEKFLQSHDNDLMPIRYTYSEIKKITNGFKDKLGEGGFGSVYKGKLCSGRFVAVKLLSNSKANGQDFINEVATIGRIHHVNVVQLLGFSVEGSKRALIYEFMPNGSLERYIFSRQGSIPLSNEKLYKISLGVARGIEYLHQGCDMQILHFDIKPHNILLDEKFVPKVSDFGLAKLYPTNNNTVPLTAARGTIGYMAPELFYKNIGGVSYKADVYSYGMLLMEMVGRRKNLNALANHSSQIYFPSWVYDQVSEGNDIEVQEDATEHEKKTTKKMIIVALWCIQLKPSDRPSMHKVVEMLESDVESLQMPPKPFLTPHQAEEKDDDRANHAKLSDPPNDYIDSSYQFGR